VTAGGAGPRASPPPASHWHGAADGRRSLRGRAAVSARISERGVQAVRTIDLPARGRHAAVLRLGLFGRHDTQTQARVEAPG
jgi:hypothetical protein